MGSQHPCHSCSINLSNWILGSVNTYLHSLPADFSKLPLACWAMYTSGLPLLRTNMSYVGFMTGLVISITLNAVMTSLIVFKILKVFRQVKPASNDQISGVTGGGKLWRILFIIIESGIVLFVTQVFRIVVTVVKTDAANNFYSIAIAMHDACNVIIRSVHCCCFY